MSTPGIESKTYYLDGFFLFSDYILLRDAFVKLYPLSELVGLCITTIKSMPTPTTFFSTGIKVMLVRYVPGTTPAVDEIKFLDVDDAATVTSLKSGSKSEAENNTYISSLQSAAKKAVSPLTPIDWWNDTLYYHDTNEFEYCFIDRQTFEYLASPTEMGFYRLDGTTYRDKNNQVVLANNASRGIYFSRAFITMEISNRFYDSYRSLKIRPYPEPALQVYDSRPSTAYYLGPACPPFWSHDGAAVTDAVMSADVSARQSVAPPGDDCTCNKVNMAALHKALKDTKVIGEDMGPAYRVNFRPIIIAVMLSFAFIAVAIIANSSLKGAEDKNLFLRNTLNAAAYTGLAFIGFVLTQLYRRIAKGF